MTEIYLGPPGTGKTTTLINLVAEEVTRMDMLNEQRIERLFAVKGN